MFFPQGPTSISSGKTRSLFSTKRTVQDQRTSWVLHGDTYWELERDRRCTCRGVWWGVSGMLRHAIAEHRVLLLGITALSAGSTRSGRTSVRARRGCGLWRRLPVCLAQLLHIHRITHNIKYIGTNRFSSTQLGLGTRDIYWTCHYTKQAVQIHHIDQHFSRTHAVYKKSSQVTQSLQRST